MTLWGHKDVRGPSGTTDVQNSSICEFCLEPQTCRHVYRHHETGPTKAHSRVLLKIHTFTLFVSLHLYTKTCQKSCRAKKKQHLGFPKELFSAGMFNCFILWPQRPKIMVYTLKRVLYKWELTILYELNADLSGDWSTRPFLASFSLGGAYKCKKL